MTEKTKALLTAFLDDWFTEFGTSYIAHYPTYYMEGGVTLSEDEIGAFGTEMFNEFIVGALNEFSEKYGGIGIHCCAASEHQWKNISRVKGLRILNLVKDPGFLKRSIKFFGNSVAHWPQGGMPKADSEPDWMTGCPDDVRVVLSYRATSRTEAIETAKHAEELCQKRNKNTAPI